MDGDKMVEMGIGAGVTAGVASIVRAFGKITTIEGRVKSLEDALVTSTKQNDLQSLHMEKLGDKMVELSIAMSALAATMKVVANDRNESRGD